MSDIGLVVAQIVDGNIARSAGNPGAGVALNGYIRECIPLKTFHPKEVIDVP